MDVECSHDGSFKHILKYINNKNNKDWSLDSFKERVLNTHQTDSLRELQLSILKNALDLVETNGHVFYSTCSISRK